MIIVLGSSGMLGTYCSKFFQNEGFLVKNITRDNFDFYSSEKEIRKYLDTLILKPHDLMINGIGVIKPQVESTGVAQTVYINGVLPHILANYCEEKEMDFIQPCTDCVFDGSIQSHPYSIAPQQRIPYTINTAHNTQDIYGKSKSIGEPSNAICIRVSIIGEEKNNKRSLIEWAKSQRNNTVDGFNNHYWSGITCLEWCHQLMTIMAIGEFPKGTIQLASPEKVTKYELLKLISDVYDLNLTINEVDAPKFSDMTLQHSTTSVVQPLRTQLEQLRDFKL